MSCCKLPSRRQEEVAAAPHPVVVEVLRWVEEAEEAPTPLQRTAGSMPSGYQEWLQEGLRDQEARP